MLRRRKPPHDLTVIAQNFKTLVRFKCQLVAIASWPKKICVSGDCTVCSIGIFIAAEFMFHILEAFLQTKPFVSECAGSVSEDGWHNGRGVEDFQT